MTKLRGIGYNPVPFFIHNTGAIEIGRHLFGVLFNPENATKDQVETIQSVLWHEYRDMFEEEMFGKQRDV